MDISTNGKRARGPILEQAANIVEESEVQMTLRALFYRLVTRRTLACQQIEAG